MENIGNYFVISVLGETTMKKILSNFLFYAFLAILASPCLWSVWIMVKTEPSLTAIIIVIVVIIIGGLIFEKE